MSSPIITYRSNMGVQTTPPFSNTYSTEFDGVDDYVSAPQSFLNSASVFSVSFWAKKVLASDDVLIGDKISTFQGAWVNWYTDGNVYFTCRTGSNITLVAALSFDTNWHHFLCTKNGTDAKIYVDGVLSAITPTNGTVAITLPATCGDNFRIGSIDASTFGNSTIDEVALWDSVIAIGDVWDGSGAATDLSLLATPPIAWYRMGDNGAYKSPQWLLPSNENKDKVSNYSFEFDAVDDYINCGSLSNLQNATEFSVSSWFKTPLAAVQGVWVWWDDADGWLELNCSADGSMIANVTRFNHTSATYGIAAAGTLTADTWYNATVVFDGSGATNADRLKLYVNGNLITLTFIGTIPTQTGTMLSSGLHIGERFNGQNYFNGNIDEVSIFDSAISIGDVWDGSGEPIDVSAVSGLANYYKMGEEATFSGGVWTVPDAVGSNDGTSNAMTIEDRVSEAPNSENNALSYNMDLVDRTTDVPT